jgi:hypothetical protein
MAAKISTDNQALPNFWNEHIEIRGCMMYLVSDFGIIAIALIGFQPAKHHGRIITTRYKDND